MYLQENIIMDKQPKANKTKLIPGKNQREADLVMTPFPLAKAIIDHLPLNGKILDPCRGQGAFFNQFPVYTTNDYCEIEEGKDFYNYKEKVDWIITNPPWSHYRTFAKHAYTLADNVGFLITNNHDMGLKARMRDMEDAGFGIKEIILVDTPPADSPWPSSGFQLGVCWKQRGYSGDIKITKLPWLR